MAHSTKERQPHQIHLVNEADQHSASLEARAPAAKNRIEIDEYIADVLIDKRSFPVVVHWIVQHRGSAEILKWGHEDTFEAASREAVAWIESLLRYDEYRKSLKR